MTKDFFNTPEHLQALYQKELRRRIHKNIVTQVEQDDNQTKTLKVSYVFTKEFTLADGENPTHKDIHNIAGKMVKDLTEQTDQFKRLYSKTDRGFNIESEELEKQYCSKNNKSIT